MKGPDEIALILAAVLADDVAPLPWAAYLAMALLIVGGIAVVWSLFWLLDRLPRTARLVGYVALGGLFLILNVRYPDAWSFAIGAGWALVLRTQVERWRNQATPGRALP